MLQNHKNKTEKRQARTARQAERRARVADCHQKTSTSASAPVQTNEIPLYITENVVSVLMRLHHEAESCRIKYQMSEYVHRSDAIKSLLEQVEKDFGEEYMLYVFMMASDRLGDTLGPLDPTILQKLIKMGCVVKKIKSVLSFTYDK